MYIGLYLKYRLFLADFNENYIFSEKSSNAKFRENPSGGG
jgi:hypothetical protein